MTTYLFIENATFWPYVITDQDGHHWGNIRPNGYYSLKVNYSPTFERQYIFSNQHGFFTIKLGRDGNISQLRPHRGIHLEVKPEEYNARIQVRAPPVMTSGMVTPCCHMHGLTRNKLLITPARNIFWRISPRLAPVVPDQVLRISP
uniref:Uncharacterized protein n=1 Tax=viral metagenome TaxID=1070528 RepID=A0A6C0BLY7_9ZZZZ